MKTSLVLATLFFACLLALNAAVLVLPVKADNNCTMMCGGQQISCGGDECRIEEGVGCISSSGGFEYITPCNPS